MLYFVALLPLSVLFQKGISTAFLVRTVIFSVLGAAGGKWVFHKQFSDYFVKGYELNEYTAVIIFGVCGLVYSLIDGFLAKKVAWVTRDFQAITTQGCRRTWIGVLCCANGQQDSVIKKHSKDTYVNRLRI